MDHVEYLAVHFHWDGDLVNSGGSVSYIGGSDDLVYIERNKISLTEIRGHFREVSDKEADDKRFQWLMPGRDMSDGFILLYDDMSFELMKNTILDWSYAEVFVEKLGIFEAPITESHGGNIAGSNLITPIVSVVEEEDEESSDSEYVPGDSSSSEEDDEATVITAKFKDYKKMLRAGKYEHLDEIYFEGLSIGSKNMVGDDNEDGSAYEDN